MQVVTVTNPPDISGGFFVFGEVSFFEVFRIIDVSGQQQFVYPKKALKKSADKRRSSYNKALYPFFRPLLALCAEICDELTICS